MAAAFIRGLPEVDKDVLEKGETCYICLEEYGKAVPETGVVERALRLPCNHVMGSTCLNTWLGGSATHSGTNTCPVCRKVLFPQESLPPNPLVRIFLPNDTGSQSQEQDPEGDDGSDDDGWMRTTGEYNSETRLRRYLQTQLNLPPPREQPEDVREELRVLVRTARQIREEILYRDLRHFGANLPPMRDDLQILDPERAMTSEHEDAFFQFMDAHGAFERPFGNVGNMSHRQIWGVLRDMRLVWKPDTENSHLNTSIWEGVGRLPENGSENRSTWEWVGVLEMSHET